MKYNHQINRWGGLLTAVGIAYALALGSTEAGDSKPFKETGTESVVATLAPGALLQPLFQEAQALYGDAVWTGVIQQFSHNNVGGRGNSVVFEAVHVDPTAPTGVIVYAMKYETVANGDQFVVAGYFIPQSDGTLAVNFSLIPELGTGRFAGAIGAFNVLTPLPGGYSGEGTITTVGSTKNQ